jgi:hypothetical protein
VVSCIASHICDRYQSRTLTPPTVTLLMVIPMKCEGNNNTRLISIYPMLLDVLCACFILPCIIAPTLTGS